MNALAPREVVIERPTTIQPGHASCETNRRRFVGLPRSHSRSQEGPALSNTFCCSRITESRRSLARALALAVDRAAHVPIYVAEELQERSSITSIKSDACSAMPSAGNENGAAWWRRTKISEIARTLEFPFENLDTPQDHESAFENRRRTCSKSGQGAQVAADEGGSRSDNPPLNLVVHTSRRRIRERVITTGTSDSCRSAKTGVRMGHGLLHQPHAAGKSGQSF